MDKNWCLQKKIYIAVSLKNKNINFLPSLVSFFRACCLRSCVRKKTPRRRPSRCWSTCAPCRTSCSFRRPSATASIRRRGSGASRQRPRWAPLPSSARRPVGQFRYRTLSCWLPHRHSVLLESSHLCFLIKITTRVG